MREVESQCAAMIRDAETCCEVVIKEAEACCTNQAYALEQSHEESMLKLEDVAQPCGPVPLKPMEY